MGIHRHSPTIPGFTDGKELVGSDGLGRTLSGVYTAGTGGTNYATLTQVNYERSSGFVVGTLYSMIWRQGKLAAAALYVGDTVGSAQLASELGGTSSISFTADTLNAGRYLVSVPNAYVKAIADAEDAANIRSLSSLSTNPSRAFCATWWHRSHRYIQLGRHCCKHRNSILFSLLGLRSLHWVQHQTHKLLVACGLCLPHHCL